MVLVSRRRQCGTRSLAKLVVGLLLVTTTSIGGVDAAPVAASTANPAADEAPDADAPDAEVIDFDHPISVDDANDVITAERLEVQSIEFLVGNGIGHHVFDPSVSAEENAMELSENLKQQAPGGNAAVISATVQVERSDGRAISRGGGASVDAVVDAAALLPEQGNGDVDLTELREEPDGLPSSYEPAVEAQAANTDIPPTRAHPNTVWIQTKDKVAGKRQVVFNARWINKSNARNAPHWWGSEFQLHQRNADLSSSRSRPLCAVGTDAKFWADASLKGATMVAVINDGLPKAKMEQLETYIDSNHLLDPCSQGSIGFGIGHPYGIPDMKFPLGGPDTVLHQDIYVDMRLKPGKLSRSSIWAATKYVPNNCPGGAAHTDCMGLTTDPARPWPTSKLGGGTDMLLLNKSRNWRTPTHFSWDEYADRRPKPLQ